MIQLCIDRLANNKIVLAKIFSSIPSDEYNWKPEGKKWNILEVLCHMYDEEREDFRKRVTHTLTTPGQPAPPIDPEGWVTERKYAEWDYNDTLEKLLIERDRSIDILSGLIHADWENEYRHMSIGPIKAKGFLANWLAHDYLHIRQVHKIRFLYLEFMTKTDLRYAGIL